LFTYVPSCSAGVAATPASEFGPRASLKFTIASDDEKVGAGASD
jgi:hypothetical protein